MQALLIIGWFAVIGLSLKGAEILLARIGEGD